MFDRDGTLNVDTRYLHEPEKLELIPSTVDIMRGYTEDPDYKVVVVTNQAGIAKGLYTEADMRRLHRYMEDELERLGVHVDAWYFCPHHPDYTGQRDCRKPAPGMLLAAMRNFDANAVDCVMFGDMPTDVAAARTADINFIHVYCCLYDYPKVHYCVAEFQEIAASSHTQGACPEHRYMHGIFSNILFGLREQNRFHFNFN